MAEYLFDEHRFHDPEIAREHLEAIRWPKGPVCPHCGAFDRISKLNGNAHRPGVYDCGHCRDQFTVTVGTVFERSKITLDKWLFAATLIASSKKGVSSKQIERMLGVTYKTAWFMTHRLREAMKSPGGVMGSGGGTVEVDETYIGRKPGRKIARGYQHVSSHHLHRYTTEFDFRYNYRQKRMKINGKWTKTGHDDAERTAALLKGIDGKRLTYRRINAAA